MQKLRGSFYWGGVVFAKGCEFLLVWLGEGFGVGFRWVVGCGFPVENEGKGEGNGGGGGGVGKGKGTGKSLRMSLSKLLRAARLQNKVATEIVLNQYEKWFEKRKRDPKNDPTRARKMFSPSHAA